MALNSTEQIELYLREGVDPDWTAFGGGSALEAMEAATRAARDALVAEVARRVPAGPRLPEGVGDLSPFVRAKVEPMVRGLFPAAEREVVLDTLAGSVVVLTHDNIERVLREESFDHAAWSLANLYLGSAGAELLGPDAARIVGLSQDRTCFVTVEYFEVRHRFADFIVHEAAHVFHNCKGETLGLARPRRREWLLPIAYAERENFAYACEAYAKIVALGTTPAARRGLAAEFARTFRTTDESVDPERVGEMVGAAAEVRNGWKVILRACEERGRRPRSAHGARAEL